MGCGTSSSSGPLMIEEPANKEEEKQKFTELVLKKLVASWNVGRKHGKLDISSIHTFNVDEIEKRLNAIDIYVLLEEVYGPIDDRQYPENYCPMQRKFVAYTLCENPKPKMLA